MTSEEEIATPNMVRSSPGLIGAAPAALKGQGA
jgi:hypothetical protein